MMGNSTFPSPMELPPLPDYSLQIVPPLVPPIPDKYFLLLIPLIAYWIMSGIFHIMDTYDLCAKYRLHTPVELLRRNKASRWDVLRDVVTQQVVQTVFGIVIGYFEVENVTGKEEYDVAVWATRLRLAQRGVPSLLALFGLDAQGLSKKAMSNGYRSTAAVLVGGLYPGLVQRIVVHGEPTLAPAFASWELIVAKSIFWCLIPAFQFLVAIIFLDAWQYFLHRGMHMNKYLYTTIHSRHHRLYVPYAYGALYNHPVEGFVLDTLGAGVAYMLTGMTARQGMCFYGGSCLKTVDDHCGYALPWDPLQHLTSNNAGYHNIHHQSWGIKTNFSQPFFTFWDRVLDTQWTSGDTSARYARNRANAHRVDEKEKAMAGERTSAMVTTTEDVGIGGNEEAVHEHNTPVQNRLVQRPTGSGGLKAIRVKVDGQLRVRRRAASKSDGSSSHPIGPAIP